MRKLLFALIAITTVFVSCEKDEIDFLAQEQTRIEEESIARDSIITENLEAVKNQLIESINVLRSDLEAAVAALEAADAAIQAYVASEVEDLYIALAELEARFNEAVVTLQANIDANLALTQGWVTQLATALQAESQARLAGDTALANELSSQVAALRAQDAALYNNIVSNANSISALAESVNDRVMELNTRIESNSSSITLNSNAIVSLEGQVGVLTDRADDLETDILNIGADLNNLISDFGTASSTIADLVSGSATVSNSLFGLAAQVGSDSTTSTIELHINDIYALLDQASSTLNDLSDRVEQGGGEEVSELQALVQWLDNSNIQDVYESTTVSLTYYGLTRSPLNGNQYVLNNPSRYQNFVVQVMSGNATITLNGVAYGSLQELFEAWPIIPSYTVRVRGEGGTISLGNLGYDETTSSFNIRTVASADSGYKFSYYQKVGQTSTVGERVSRLPVEDGDIWEAVFAPLSDVDLIRIATDPTGLQTYVFGDYTLTEVDDDPRLSGQRWWPLRFFTVNGKEGYLSIPTNNAFGLEQVVAYWEGRYRRHAYALQTIDGYNDIFASANPVGDVIASMPDIEFDPSTVTSWTPEFSTETADFVQTGVDANSITGTRTVSVSRSTTSTIQTATEASEGVDFNGDGDMLDTGVRNYVVDTYTATAGGVTLGSHSVPRDSSYIVDTNNGGIDVDPAPETTDITFTVSAGLAVTHQQLNSERTFTGEWVARLGILTGYRNTNGTPNRQGSKIKFSYTNGASAQTAYFYVNHYVPGSNTVVVTPGNSNRGRGPVLSIAAGTVITVTVE